MGARLRQKREGAKADDQDGGGAAHRQKAGAGAAQRGTGSLFGVGIVGLHHALLKAGVRPPPEDPMGRIYARILTSFSPVY